jgi:hypothetical protein
MDENYIVPVFVMLAEGLRALNYEDHSQAEVSGAEILFVAVMAAKYFHNQHDRALAVFIRIGDIGQVSVSRYNRRLHQLADWLPALIEILGEVFAQGEIFIVDSFPLPVCKRVRARRCRKVRGIEYCGYCAAKKEKFFGWRLHLICDTHGIPVSFDVLPAACQDLTPIHELSFNLPADSRLLADKAYLAQADSTTIAEETGVNLIAARRKNMSPLPWAEDWDLRHYRRRIETMYSQLEAMGLQHLHARTQAGFELKVFASLLALTFTNFF